MSHLNLGRRGFLALVAALLLVGPPAAQARPRIEPLEIVTSAGRVKLQVEIADTEPLRERGLMFRKSLAPDHGMLFDFKSPRPVAFWMRNTLIPLDMIFIRPDGRVLSIARNTRPLDETPVPSGGAIRGVLEIAGGRAAELGILPGDRVIHRIFPRG